MLKCTPLKKGTSTLKRAPLKKVSKKGVEKIVSRVAEMKLMHEAFYTFWNSRPHRCQSCGCSLGDVLHSYHVDHLLEKSKYPEFKLEPLNFYLVCLTCHNSKTNGKPTENHRLAIENAKKLLLN